MIKEETKTIIHEDANGEITSDTTSITTNYRRNLESDYVKLYTKMWINFQVCDPKWVNLLLQLSMRMTYCNTTDEEGQGGQVVMTGGIVGKSIRKALGWGENMYAKGLRALCDCGAIRRIGRGSYQINPMYVGKGEWRYNPKLERGGIEDLVTTFNFREGTVDTKIVWADNDTDQSDDAKAMRNNIGSDFVIKRCKTKARKKSNIKAVKPAKEA